MQMRKYLFLSGILWGSLFSGCGNTGNDYDATGTFEATDVIVSAEGQGKILELNLDEGDLLSANQVVGVIDSLQLYLQKQQLIANNRAITTRSVDIGTQIAALQEQIVKQKREKQRFEDLFRNRAATQKQVDDIDAQLKVLERQLAAQLSNMQKSNRGVADENEALVLQIATLSDRIQKCRIQSPIEGTVLVKYMESGEFATPGKPIFKVGDLKRPYLRAYLTSEQLSEVRLNQEVEVFADYGGGNLRRYSGVISWIGEQAEFTPKGIQTRNERANLVYPVKVRIENDGNVRIGMYGGIRFLKGAE